MELTVRNRKSILVVALVAILAIFSLSVYGEGVAHAAPVVGFNPGKIIDDSVFTNAQSMNTQQIQAFFESKVSSCDTWGTRGSTSTSRRDYIRSYGYDTPLMCLRDFKEGDKSAAQIIYDASQEFQINPQVLIVLLQKEQGLVTDDWPGPWQYKTAMGYGCPDSTPGVCDADYKGFTNQTRWAARMFRAIMNNAPTWYTPYVLGNNYIQYNPDKGCGGSTVNIQNRATQALYNYTPYQPNQGAIDAGWGEAYCGAYGNRNFYLYFTEWFGSTQGSLDVSEVSLTKDSVGQMFTGEPMTIQFTARNQTKSTFVFNAIGVAVRGPSGENLDPGWDSNVSIAPGATYTYKKTINPVSEGNYKIYLSSYASNDSGWRECELNSSQSTCYSPKLIQNPVQILSTPQFISKKLGTPINELRANQSFTGSYVIKNTSTRYAVEPGRVTLAGRTASGLNRDMAGQDAGSLAPQQSFTYTGSSIYSDAPMTYRYFTATTKDGGRSWEDMSFKVAGGVAQERTLEMKSGVTLVQGPTISGDAVAGGRVTVTLKVRNYGDDSIDIGYVGVTVRGPQGQNIDPYWQRVNGFNSVDDNGVRTYQATFSPTAAGSWTVDYMQVSNDFKIWNSNYPVSADNTVRRSVVLPVKEVVTLLQGPKVVGVNHVGQASTITMKLKTSALGPVDLGRIGVTVRGPQGQNSDPLWQRIDNLSNAVDDGVHTYQAQFTPSGAGSWDIGYMHTAADYSVWDASRIVSEDSSVRRNINIEVLPQVTITSGIAVTGAILGTHKASVTVTNHGSTPVELGKLGLAVRDPQNNNRDAWWEDFTIPANSSRTHTVNVNFNKVGKWSFEVTSLKSGVWSATNPIVESNNVLRRIVVDVK